MPGRRLSVSGARKTPPMLWSVLPLLLAVAALLPRSLSLGLRSPGPACVVVGAAGMILNPPPLAKAPRRPPPPPPRRLAAPPARPAPLYAASTPWPLPSTPDCIFEGERDLGGYFMRGGVALLGLLGADSCVILSSEDCKHAHNPAVRRLVQLCFSVYRDEIRALEGLK